MGYLLPLAHNFGFLLPLAHNLHGNANRGCEQILIFFSSRSMYANGCQKYVRLVGIGSGRLRFRLPLSEKCVLNYVEGKHDKRRFFGSLFLGLAHDIVNMFRMCVCTEVSPPPPTERMNKPAPCIASVSVSVSPAPTRPLTCSCILLPPRRPSRWEFEASGKLSSIARAALRYICLYKSMCFEMDELSLSVLRF